MLYPRLLVGTAGGMLFSTLGQLGVPDVFRTAALAAIGAVVSFFVTLLLQRLLRRK